MQHGACNLLHACVQSSACMRVRMELRDPLWPACLPPRGSKARFRARLPPVIRLQHGSTQTAAAIRPGASAAKSLYGQPQLSAIVQIIMTPRQAELKPSRQLNI